MSKKYAVFITVLFCGFLALMGVWNLLAPDRTFSEEENRILAQRPALALSAVRTGKLMSDFETYVTDQFPGRDGWIAAKAWAERLFGKQENNGIYFGKYNTLIPRFDEPDQQRLENNLNCVAQFAENSPIPVTFSLIPTAATIWADRLPQGAPNYNQLLIRRQAEEAVDCFDSGVDMALWSARADDIYYRTDHHWNSYGAYQGYVGLSEALGYEPVHFQALRKTTVTTKFYGTSHSSSGIRWVPPDSIDIYVPEDEITVTSYIGHKAEARRLYDYGKLDQKDKYAFFLGGQQPLCVIETGREGPKLLIVRDSYADSLAPFLTAHFSEIHLVDLRYYKGSIQDYIAGHAIDRALVLYSVPNFITDSNLAWLTR